MKRSLVFLLPALLMVTTSLTVRAQKSSFTVEGVRPYDKAVPGQIMDVLIEGLGSLDSPMILPETDFKVEVTQDGGEAPTVEGPALSEPNEVSPGQEHAA